VDDIDRRTVANLATARNTAAEVQTDGLSIRSALTRRSGWPAFSQESSLFSYLIGDIAMKRRDMLLAGGAAALGLSSFPLGWVAAAEKKKQKLLYFTRSVGYEHSVVSRKGGQPSHSERILGELGKKAGFEVECTEDGRVFDPIFETSPRIVADLDGYDAIVLYNCGDMTQPNERNNPPMTAKGAGRLLEAVADGKPLVAIHSACYWGDKPGPEFQRCVAMVGAQFVSHGEQQESTMQVTAPDFPGLKGLPKSFRLLDEWYAMKNFAKDMHVILAEDSEGMKGEMYQRPPFPSTWARLHGKGRVFYTAMGHREDVWTNRIFQRILLGGIAWVLGNVEAEITPNIDKVTPQAGQLSR
jgi:type 1 glutamine amidotransferase